MVMTDKAGQVDIDAIWAEAAAEVEKCLTARINELSDANVNANAELKALRKKLESKAKADSKPGDNSNVVQADFTGAVDPELDGEFLTEKDAIAAFSGALASMRGLTFSASAFWKEKGKSGTHGKAVHKHLLEANATIGLLILEYSR